MKHGNFGNGPALVGAGDLELDHRDGVRGATHDTQTAANALLLVDNHIGAARPTLGELVQRISLDHAREPFHADTIVGADIDAAGAENADGGIDHDIQLTLQAATSLFHGLLGGVTDLRLARVAIPLFQWQARDHLVRGGLVVIDHAAAKGRPLNLLSGFGRVGLATPG